MARTSNHPASRLAHRIAVAGYAAMPALNLAKQKRG
jgi:hypothetical protein